MRIVCLSDTHRTHNEYTEFLQSIGGDLLIHAGDSDSYDWNTAWTFASWARKVAEYFTFGALVTFGNHDKFVHDPDNLERIKEFTAGSKVQFLVNESVKVGRLNFWLTPYSLPYGDLFSAFTLPDEHLAKVYEEIPDDTDVIVSHSPMHGVLDRYYGSYALGVRIRHLAKLKRLKLVVCGHIHEAHGIEFDNEICFVNASSIGPFEIGLWQPIVVDISEDGYIAAEPAGPL